MHRMREERGRDQTDHSLQNRKVICSVFLESSPPPVLEAGEAMMDALVGKLVVELVCCRMGGLFELY